jgi:hypothetical protein
MEQLDYNLLFRWLARLRRGLDWSVNAHKCDLESGMKRRVERLVLTLLLAVVVISITPEHTDPTIALHAQTRGNGTTMTTDGGTTLNWTGAKNWGSYANGDRWIEAPAGISITSKSPSDIDPAGGTLHGCVTGAADRAALPAWPGQIPSGQAPYQKPEGFDSRLQGLEVGGVYSSTLNVSDSFPFSIATNTMLLCAISYTTPIYNRGTAGHLKIIEPIAIVSSAPAAKSMRPGFWATSMTPPANQSAVSARLDVLPDIDVKTVAGEPTVAQMNQTWRNFLYKSTYQPTTAYRQNATRNAGYNSDVLCCGKVVWGMLADALVGLSMNYTDAEKLPLATRIAQQAIDLYSQYQAGFHWHGVAGSFADPVKTLFVVGASLLNNADMMAAADVAVVGPNVWYEDQAFFTVRQLDVDTLRRDLRGRVEPDPLVRCGDNNQNDTNPCAPFTTAMIGKYHWMANYYGYNPVGSGGTSRGYGGAYAWIVTHAIPTALVIRLMDLEEELGLPAANFPLGINTIQSSWNGTTWTSSTFGWAWPEANVTGKSTACCSPVLTAPQSGGGVHSVRVYVPTLITHINDTRKNGNVTGGITPDQLPIQTVTTAAGVSGDGH